MNFVSGRPTVAPPRPPSIKPPPPPTPNRSISNTNLSNLPLSLPPSATSTNNGTQFGSVSNISSALAKQQHRHQISTGSVNDVSSMHNSNISNTSSSSNTLIGSSNSLSIAAAVIDRSPNGVAPPPLPPHRTCPAPPPPLSISRNVSSAGVRIG